MPKITDGRRRKQGGTGSSDVRIPDALQFESLMFVSQLPGPLIKYGSDLLSKISVRAKWVFSDMGIQIVSQSDDPDTNVSASLHLGKNVFQHLQCQTPVTLNIESPELSLSCKHLRRRDTVTLYVNSSACFGVITESPYHTKNSVVASTECGAAESSAENFTPSSVHTTSCKDWDPNRGIRIAGGTFQRMIRDYRSTGKKINVSGNNSYVLFELDLLESLHRTDKTHSVPCSMFEGQTVPDGLLCVADRSVEVFFFCCIR